MLSERTARAEAKVEQSRRGLPSPKITDVRAIATAPRGLRLVVVKVTTDQDGLYGYGCATYTQRADLVVPAVDRYLKPFLVGRKADRIDDAAGRYVVCCKGTFPEATTLAGMRADGTLIYAGLEGERPDGLTRLPKTTRVIRVDAQTIAIEEKSRANAVLIGTLAAALPFLDREALRDALRETFAGRHPEAVASNDRAFMRGAEEIEVIEHVGRADGDLPALTSDPLWGYRTAPIGGIGSSTAPPGPRWLGPESLPFSWPASTLSPAGTPCPGPGST